MKEFEYWLKFNYWDKPPEDLREVFLGLDVEDTEDLIKLLASQLSRTSEYWEKYPNFSEDKENNYPTPVSEIWEWMKTGKGVEPYFRPQEKLGIYEGELESTERIPAQCMMVVTFVGSGLKSRGIPTRYRNILIERSGEWGKGYGSHWVLEYCDGEIWKLVDPKKLERGLKVRPFKYGWQMTDDLREGKVDPDTIVNFYKTKKGKEFVARILIRDTIGLSGESIIPWEVHLTYRGLDFEEAFERYGYDQIVEDLYEITKNPNKENLERIRKEGIVGYRMVGK